MVSAGEALAAAVHEGSLEKKRRAGGWKRRQFVLTPVHLLSFDSLESPAARSTLATLDVLSVRLNPLDVTQRGFELELFRSKKEFRASTTAERDAWVSALSSVAGVHKRSLQPVDPVESADASSVDLRSLCEQLKRSLARQLQASKAVTAREVVAALQSLRPGLPHRRLLELGQELVDLQLLVPLQSHVFDEHDAGRLKFAESSGNQRQRQPKNHLAMRAQSIADLMGSPLFDATKYAEDFLRKHPSDKIDGHCKKLIAQKDQTTEELKEEISGNYSSFIRAAGELKAMEHRVSQLKTLVLDCKRSIHSLQAVALEPTASTRPPPAFEAAERKQAARAMSSALDGFVYDLEVCLHERDFAGFTAQLLEYLDKRRVNVDVSSDAQHAKVLELRGAFVQQLLDDFNASMQASERMHKRETQLQMLIQLGYTPLATDMCLQSYSVRMALQLRHVPSTGSALNYVVNLSRTFFSALLVCYEDYAHSFRGQRSAHFVSLTVWISSQLERFASELLFHVFPTAAKPLETRQAVDPDGSSVAIDVSEFKNVARFVANALRYVFYGSRQLELAGLPTAHCLAPHLVPGIDAFLDTYASAVKSALRDEVKRERWEMMKRAIRDPETQEEREIILTQSGRSFYSMLQQFLRDAQRVLNPSCATSYLAEVYDAVVGQADELLLQYSAEAVRYLTTSKASSSLRPKQIVGLLTNVAYIHDDCAARSTVILSEFIPKAVLQARDRPVKAAELWGKTVEAGMKRCADSLLAMTINWRQLELSDEAPPDVTSGKSMPVRLLFADAVLKEVDAASNAQMDRALAVYCDRRGGAETECSRSPDGEGSILLGLVVEAMLQQILDDSTWWQQFDGSTRDKKRVGSGGVSRFIAEVKALEKRSSVTPQLQDVSERLVAKLTKVFEQTHAKGAVLATQDWTDAYVAMISRPQGTTDASSLSVN